MNIGTKIRTVARVAVSAYTAFCIWQTAVDGFGNKTVSLIWAILIIACGWVVDFMTTWYNNDYTEVADKYTTEMRLEKARLKAEDEADAEEEGDEHGVAYEETETDEV